MAKSGGNSKKNSGKQAKTTKKKISITTSTPPRKQTRKSVYTKIGPGGVLEEKQFLEYDDNGREIQRVVTYKNGKAVSERITRPKKFKNALRFFRDHTWASIILLIIIGVGAGLGISQLLIAPDPFTDGEPFQPERSGKVPGGTYTVPSINIPQDISIEVEDDLILNITGNTKINGTLKGTCKKNQHYGKR